MTEPKQAPVFVALLGASNLSMALPSAVRHLVAQIGSRPVTVFVADGFGRSYGIEAGMFGFRLPGILRCGLFDALEEIKRGTPSADVLGLLTDVGNDIMYGAGVDTLCGWIAASVARLRNMGASVAITALPIAAITALPPWRYRLLRRIFFPRRSMLQDDLNCSLAAVQSKLAELQANQHFSLLPTRTEWYSFDRFHLRPRASSQAMASWIDALTQIHFGAVTGRGNGPTVSTLPLYLRCPAEFSFLGWCHKSKILERLISPNVRVRFY